MNSDLHIPQSLVKFYKKEIDKKVKMNLEGLVFRICGSGPPNTCYQRESKVMGRKGITLPRAREIRRRILNGELYDAMINAQESIDGGLERIVETTNIPVVTEALLWLGRDNKLKSTKKGKFQDKFKLPSYYLALSQYLIGISTLKILSKNPDIIDEMDEDSAYFIHRFFRKKRKGPTQRELEAEIAQVIINIIPEELVGKLEAIEHYICIGSGSVGGIKVEWLGKYGLPRSGRREWIKREGAEEELDRLYNNPETKRLIYTVLNDCLVALSKIIFGNSNDYRKKLMSSPFRINKTEYCTIKQMIENFAINQALYVWRESNGKHILTTALARSLGMTVRGGPKKLQVRYKTATFTYSKKGKFENTTVFLPYAVYFLNRLYKGTKELVPQ